MHLALGTRLVETASAVQMEMVAFGPLSLDHFHRCLQKPPQKTLQLSHSYSQARRDLSQELWEKRRTKSERIWTLNS